MMDSEKEKRSELTTLDRENVIKVLELVDESGRLGKHPFAAIVVGVDGQLVCSATNNSLPPDGDPTNHAELVAASMSFRKIAAEGRDPIKMLSTATPYTSAEPCAMCAGAIYWCGIGRVIYVLSEQKL